jgi:hypothetical protein
MNPRDRIRLQHLADALNSAIRFARGRERGDLDSDEMLLFALVRRRDRRGGCASFYRSRRRRHIRRWCGAAARQQFLSSKFRLSEFSPLAEAVELVRSSN